MILRMFTLGRVAALLLLGLLAFGATPAAAGCGYDGCYAPPAPVVVQPVYYQSSCSCCGCGASYYATYYPAYTYPAIPAVVGYGGCGGCGYGGVGYGGYGGYGAVGVGYAGYGPGYGAGYGGPVVGPRLWGPRRYVGPRRVYARRY
jgi:hypothetical protein